MDIRTSLLIFNGVQEKEFSLYNVLIYYLTLKAYNNEYQWGYDFYNGLRFEKTTRADFIKLKKLKRQYNKIQSEKKYVDPLPVHYDYTIWKLADVLAMLIYSGIRNTSITITKRAILQKYDYEWVTQNFSKAECLELKRQKDIFLQEAKAKLL